jgi:S1-C subfamily serine protease
MAVAVLLLAAVVLPVFAAEEEGEVLSDVKDAIVKIYTVRNSPDYYNPWSMKGPQGGTGSGCVIEGKRILSNAHVVSDETFIQVRRYGDARKYRAHVEWVSHDADLALLKVEDESFFKGIEPLELGTLPEPQQEVVVYGFPLGGDTLSTTEGVISRIEHRTYVHSSMYLLAAQMDAAINPGNSGGPVLVNDKIVGVVMQGIRQADNIGYMVPVPIIRHFFEDIKDGKHDGFPSLGIVMQKLENPDLKAKYGVPEDETGMLIFDTVPGSPAEGVLRKGDVLVSVEGHEVADDGTVEFRPRERTSVALYIQERQIGEPVVLQVLRGGEKMSMDIELFRASEHDRIIPNEQYDRLPSYYIYGGLVFCPLTKNLLQAWGGNWHQRAPRELVALLSDNFVTEDREQVVLVLKVLAADVNEGYHGISNWVVDTVDGVKVRDLPHLVRLIENPSSENAFVTIANESGREIVLDREKVAASIEEILSTYQVSSARSVDLMNL